MREPPLRSAGKQDVAYWHLARIMDTFHLATREALTELCRRWRISELAVFGSVARGSARSDSDVDLLVTFRPDAPWSTLDLVDLREELANLFGRSVDLIEEKAIRNPWRKASILRDKSVLYAA
jgi:predicted nucleotidyltransferase